MDKSTAYRRQFLLEGLPDPLTAASRHLQLFDNYIAGTRIRIRKVRDPETRSWTHILQQVSSFTAISEMHLNNAEHAALERFEGREIRKNRYFHEFDAREFTFDVYLGSLWGLCIAFTEFDSPEAAAEFIVPTFAVFDVSSNEFFAGANLVEKKFDDVREEVARLEQTTPVPKRAAQE
jgi:CYTH domain-containing protein